VIVKVQVEVLVPSFAVQVTVEVPTGKVEPDAGAHTTVVIGLQLSDGVGSV
jgi:hypothetical protein